VQAHLKELANKINQLKTQRKAVVVAHNYQIDEVQEIADEVGDSFALSRFCADTNAEVIVFCGVHFMAESAKILSQDKTVLLPAVDAGCPMADMVTVEGLKALKQQYPDAAVVCYVNSTAAVKAESDICCTSANAVKVVSSLAQKRIIFIPDKNLAHYVSLKVPDKEIIFWDGYCITHHRITLEDVQKARRQHPDAVLLVHPECRPEVAAAADVIGSTKQIIDYALQSKADKFIIGTEMGVIFRLKRENPAKTFYLLSQGLICPNMKKTNLETVFESLDKMQYKIELDEGIRQKAYRALNRMLEVG
jgi:quinolinate synthase